MSQSLTFRQVQVRRRSDAWHVRYPAGDAYFESWEAALCYGNCVAEEEVKLQRMVMREQLLRSISR